MIKVTIDDLEINIKRKCDKITEHYIKILATLMKKGLDNHGFQLHVLSVIHTGKTFTELIYEDSKESDDAEAILALIKDLPIHLLMKNLKVENTGKPDLTETTIEDFLRASNKPTDDTNNNENDNKENDDNGEPKK